MKKFLAIMLAILMIVTTVPFAFAADDYAVVDTEAGTVTIDGTLGGKTTATEDDVNALVEKLKGYVDSGITTIIVTGSEPALHNFYDIDTSAVSAALYCLADGRSDSPYCGTIDLILPDVTEIVDDEFNNTFALNSITLPKVTTVGDGAFYATIFLQTLTFGSVITFVNEKSSGPFHMDGYEVGGYDLVLNCGQLQAEDKYKPNFETNVWFIGDWSGEYEWKSITLTHTGGEATCIAKTVCETCGEEYGDIDANNHTLVQKDAKAPTCTEIGWDAYEYCTVCDYTTYVELPADPDAHTPLEAVKENEVAPECGVAGSYDLVVYCDDCGAELDRETVAVDALIHSFTKYAVTEEAKCGVAGKEVATCDHGCGATDEKAIAALTHKDADGDYKCDNGCGHEFEKPAPEEPTPDTPDEPEDETCADCGKVHTNFFSEIICFFTRIINFIKNLFA